MGEYKRGGIVDNEIIAPKISFTMRAKPLWYAARWAQCSLMGTSHTLDAPSIPFAVDVFTINMA